MGHTVPVKRLLLLLPLLAFWCWSHPPVLQLWTGRCHQQQLTFFRAHGAHVRATQHGMRLEADRGGVQALAGWCAHLQMARDLAIQNLANCNTNKTADGTPYRRQFLEVTPDGESLVRTDCSDYNWVYDPCNPNAEQDGDHKGYVAMPNIRQESERAHLQQLNEELPRYRQALEELSKMVDPGHRLALDPLVEEPSDPPPVPMRAVSFESLMRQVESEEVP